MTRPAFWKLVLVLAGLAVFLSGVRSGSELLRWTGIGLVACAWLLRFLPRAAARPSPDPVTSSEES